MQQQKLVFTDLTLFPSLNKMLREHFTKRAKRKESLIWLIKQQKPIKFKGQVKITFTRDAVKLMDWDNHCSSCKIVFDALKMCGIIEDDNPSIVVEFLPLQNRVNKRNLEKIEVLIEGKI